MKLKLETPIKSLSELDITPQEILLFSRYQKSMYLIVDNMGLGLAVKDKSTWSLFDKSKKEEAQKYYDSLYRIPKEETETLDAFKNAIEKMEVGVHYDIDFKSYSSVYIDSHRHGEDEYFWALHSKNGMFHKYPLQSENIIKSWKTVNGAKGNLINEIKSYF